MIEIDGEFFPELTEDAKEKYNHTMIEIRIEGAQKIVRVLANEAPTTWPFLIRLISNNIQLAIMTAQLYPYRHMKKESGIVIPHSNRYPLIEPGGPEVSLNVMPGEFLEQLNINKENK